MTKSTKKAETSGSAQVIAVDAGKLSRGLKTTFEGVAMVFDALGVPADINGIGNADKAVKKDTKSIQPESEKEETDAAEEAVDTTGVGGDDAGHDAAAVPDDNQADAVMETKLETGPETEKGDESASTISLDDVTKIIVQKIKQDRGNNQKIGQILKTYGATKVGELDPKKYEAFLTDLAAL